MLSLNLTMITYMTSVTLSIFMSMPDYVYPCAHLIMPVSMHCQTMPIRMHCLIMAISLLAWPSLFVCPT